VRITPTEGAVIVAQADDGFLSVENDTVTIVAGAAALA
jgi:F-type H+-transporting ATPase subunit epsilon